MKTTIDIDIKKAREWLAKNYWKKYDHIYDRTPEEIMLILIYELRQMGVSKIDTKVITTDVYSKISNFIID